MKTHQQLLNQCFTNAMCKVLFSILATVSVHAVAIGPTLTQKLEFERYVAPIYEKTAQLPWMTSWKDFHVNNNYVRNGIVGYTVPKKAVESGGLFVAHGMISARIPTQTLIRQRIIYRFNGDGSYWVLYV